MQKKQKSLRNKTIDFSLENGQKWLNRCFFPSENTSYELNTIKNKTICANSFSLFDFLPRNFAQLIIVDPPYNLQKNYHGTIFSKKSKTTYAEYTKNWLSHILPLLAENGSIYICCDWQTSLIIAPILSEYLTIQNRITWKREKGRGSQKNWKNAMEDIWFATKTNTYTFNIDSVKIKKRVIAPYTQNGQPKDWTEDTNGKTRLTHPANFWDDISIPYWSMSENTAHPTQKPEKLLAKLILASSNKNDIVFDPFAGSGSTLVTAKKLARNYVGIEQNPLYCSWAEYRLDCAEKNPTIQGYENGIFYERNFKKPIIHKN